MRRGFPAIYLWGCQSPFQNNASHDGLRYWVWGEALRLRRFPVEGVDLLDADVAGRQQRIFWPQSGPPAPPPSGQLSVATDSGYAFQLSIVDPHPVERQAAVKRVVEVHVCTVTRPIRIPRWNPDQILPLPSFQAIDFQLLVICRHRKDVAAIGRPAR